MYVKVENDKIVKKYTVNEIDSEYPNHLVYKHPAYARAKKPNDDLLKKLGIFPVISTDAPGQHLKYVHQIECEPKKRNDGKWYQTWKMQPFSKKEMAKIFVSKKVLKDRVTICMKCDKHNKLLNTCKVCGCWLTLKRKLVYAHCELNKW
jgi:hypothetical protein